MKPPYSVTKLASSDMREQIASVVIHWSMLELVVERVIANLEGQGGIVTFKENLPQRLTSLKKLAKARLPSEQAIEISRISGDIKILSDERHRVVHGLWGLDANGDVVSIYHRHKRGTRDRPMNAQHIRQIKLLIWDKIRRLRKFEPQALSVVPS